MNINYIDNINNLDEFQLQEVKDLIVAHMESIGAFMPNPDIHQKHIQALIKVYDAQFNLLINQRQENAKLINKIEKAIK